MPYKNKEAEQKYYQDNRDKILKNQKEYNKNNKDKIKKYNKEYYYKNKGTLIKKSKDYIKKINYRYEKTEPQRLIRNIKRKTRYNFPLANNKCKCGNQAEHRHHTTNPIEFDKFIFICKKCHKKLHSNIKEVQK